MIEVYLGNVKGTWFGLACSGQEIAATTLSPERQKALANLLRSLPPGSGFDVSEQLPSFAKRIIPILERLHRGTQQPVDLPLASEYLSEPRATVLRIASHIPVGYVTSYGSIAKIAGVEPRIVGQIMASNPLYPIVPCHRVVGTDFSLVGYGGKRSPDALRAKLVRLIKERKGFMSAEVVQVAGGLLRIYPVERVIQEARKRGISLTAARQLSLASY